MPHHHPDDALLIEYAGGSLGEAKALLVATHLALCPLCRSGVSAAEIAGAAMAFDAIEPAEVGTAPNLAAVERQAPPSELGRLANVPQPLRGYLGAPVSELPWETLLSGMRAYTLPAFVNRSSVRLLAIEPGRRMPRHTHEGLELTLVLQGSFVDGSGVFAKGDVATADASIDHQPQAGGEELCLCLAVEDAPLKLTGLSGTLFNLASAAGQLFKR